MASTKLECGWEKGTVWTGPVTCGKPAKFRVLPRKGRTCRATRNGLVCGIHKRSAEKSWDHATEPLTTSAAKEG